MDLTNDEMTDVEISIEPCVGREPENGEAQCANVTLDGDLEIGVEYATFGFL